MATVKEAGKRRHGSGSLQERSPGHWRLRAYNPITGRQVTRSYTAPREELGAGVREARKALAQLVSELEAGEVPAHGAMGSTLGGLLDEWLSHREAIGRSPTTLAGYGSNIRTIKGGPLAAKRLSRLTALDLDNWYMQLSAAGTSPASISHYHRLIRAALNQAVRWQLVTRNVAKDASPPSSSSREMTVPTVEQARTLVLRAADMTTSDLGAIILFAILTGLRRGELCGLMWSDVDWESRRLHVRRSVWEVRSRWGLKEPKSRQRRVIALDDSAAAVLAERRKKAELDAEAAGIALGEGYIWSTHVDGHAPRTPDYVSRSFVALCRVLEREAMAAGRPERWRFRFHDLRHLSASDMIASGVDVRTVAGRLGHADPAITLRVYSHFFEERDRAAAEGLGQRFALPTAAE
jgi:integrase